MRTHPNVSASSFSCKVLAEDEKLRIFWKAKRFPKLNKKIVTITIAKR
jgi:hypothetical protein